MIFIKTFKHKINLINILKLKIFNEWHKWKFKIKNYFIFTEAEALMNHN